MTTKATPSILGAVFIILALMWFCFPQSMTVDNQVAVEKTGAAVAIPRDSPTGTRLGSQINGASPQVAGSTSDIQSLLHSIEGQSVRSKLDALKDLAKKNAPAAASLASSLALCRVIDGRIATVKREADQRIRENHLTAEQQADIVMELEQKIQSMWKDCSGLSKEELMSSYDYFEKAAQLGDIDAMARYRFGTRALDDIEYAFRHPEELSAAKARASGRGAGFRRGPRSTWQHVLHRIFAKR